MRSPSLFAILTATTLGIGAGSANAQSPGSERALVDSFYVRYLGRSADPVGLNDQVRALCEGTPPSVVEASILASPEYYHRHGSTPEGFVIGLYRDVLGTPPTATDLNVMVQRTIATGRNAVATQVLALRPVMPVTVYSSPPVVVTPVPVVVTPSVRVITPVYVPPPVYPHHHHYHPAPGVSVRLRF